MAKGRSSSFKDAGNDLFGSKSKEKAVQQVQEAHDVQKVQQEKLREYGTTQGKKGQHAKRINMAFSDANHEYITKESRRRGMSATAFVNQIIDIYKTGQI